MLGMLLAQVKLRGQADVTEELELLLESRTVTTQTTLAERPYSFLSGDQHQQLLRYAKSSLLESVPPHLDTHQEEWKSVIESNRPEELIPALWDTDLRKCHNLILRLSSHLQQQPFRL